MIGGGILLPDKKVYYKAITNEVNDLIIIIHKDDIEATLKKNYNLKGLVSRYLKLEMKEDKVSSTVNFIESTLQTARNFPQLRESLLIQSNIKEIATMMVCDLIADALNTKPATGKSIDSFLVRDRSSAGPQHLTRIRNRWRSSDSASSEETTVWAISSRSRSRYRRRRRRTATFTFPSVIPSSAPNCR